MNEIMSTSREEVYPGAIDNQEVRGQRELVESTLLPTKISNAGRGGLEALGVVFGKTLRCDPLFCESQLPAGWKKRATAHSMLSELVDAAGQVHAHIFFKSWYHRREAFIFSRWD